MSNSAQMKSVACSTSELMDMAINPYSLDPRLPTEHSNNKTIQNLVHLLVAAVKESGILNDQSGTNSPEDILKRKRLQVYFFVKQKITNVHSKCCGSFPKLSGNMH